MRKFGLALIVVFLLLFLPTLSSINDAVEAGWPSDGQTATAVMLIVIEAMLFVAIPLIVGSAVHANNKVAMREYEEEIRPAEGPLEEPQQ